MGNVLDDPAIWARCDASTAEADALLAELIPFYRRNPDASLVSALANSGLPAQNVAANIKLTISGGMNEPQHMVTNMVWALSRHPAQREAVLADPALWAAAFDETVRWQSPIGMYPRQSHPRHGPGRGPAPRRRRHRRRGCLRKPRSSPVRGHCRRL